MASTSKINLIITILNPPNSKGLKIEQEKMLLLCLRKNGSKVNPKLLKGGDPDDD